jgi:hypothetical protein
MNELMIEFSRGGKAHILPIINQSLEPKAIDSAHISFVLMNIDVTKTVFFRASSSEIMEGWNLLKHAGIPLSLYVGIFGLNSVVKQLGMSDDISMTPIKNTDSVRNDLEPLTLELIRLCYWINRCKTDLTGQSFEVKIQELIGRLRFSDEKAIRAVLGTKMVDCGRSMQEKQLEANLRSDRLRNLKESIDFMNFRRNVSSLIPECMCAVLFKEQGYRVEFNQTSDIRKSDFTLNVSQLEIKTFLDSLTRSNRVRKSLFEEVKTTLKNRKTIRDINEALSQKADAVLLFLTFSSLAIGLAKYTNDNPIDYTFENSAENLKRLLVEKNISTVPIVIICTIIDTVLCNYRLLSFCLEYPIETDSNGKRKCNKKLLDLRKFK